MTAMANCLHLMSRGYFYGQQETGLCIMGCASTEQLPSSQEQNVIVQAAQLVQPFQQRGFHGRGKDAAVGCATIATGAAPLPSLPRVSCRLRLRTRV